MSVEVAILIWLAIGIGITAGVFLAVRRRELARRHDDPDEVVRILRVGATGVRRDLVLVEIHELRRDAIDATVAAKVRRRLVDGLLPRDRRDRRHLRLTELKGRDRVVGGRAQRAVGRPRIDDHDAVDEER